MYVYSCSFGLDHVECECLKNLVVGPISIWLTEKCMSGTDKSGLKQILDLTIIRIHAIHEIRQLGVDV